MEIRRARSPGLMLLAAAVLVGPSAPNDARSAPTPTFRDHVRPFLAEHCFGCHGDGKSRGGVSLDAAQDDEALAADRELWGGVLRAVREGEMPPKGRPRPGPAATEGFVAALDEVLTRVDCGGPRDPGRVTLRRLNRAEYTNTIRDLLFLPDFQAADDFPADDTAFGFDNNGDVLTTSPLLMEKYLAAAEAAVLAVGRDKGARARLFAGGDGVKETFQDKQTRARAILRGILPRAYRRPVTPEEFERLMAFVRLSYAQDGESTERAALLAVRAALVSPHFLFRVELDRGPAGGGVIPLDDHELASRLSYFLWSSMPDEGLFRLADEQKLRDPAILGQQALRMLADPKARALADNFVGQWLELRALEQVKPDPDLYPDFDEPLRRAMAAETRHFFASVVAEDRSIFDFLDSDYTFVNDVLARHYGIPGVEGGEFRRVRLDPARRGGVITHAGVLTLTSTPTRTSPVKRGVWILENLLNAPPPPPPPDVPPLEGDGKEVKGSLRQILMQHRASATCASCHDRIDPLGLALENYDAVGRWRDRDGSAVVDAVSELADGRRIEGPAGLRAALKGRAPEFRRCLAEKLLTYALGRGLGPSDRCVVDAICEAAGADGDRFSAFVSAIVRSEPFRHRAGPGGAKP